MNPLALFHNFVIPFIGGLCLTIGKAIADRKEITWDESNNIALDLVLVTVGALGILYINKGAVEATIDAGVGDGFLAMILLYTRHLRRQKMRQASLPPIHPVAGAFQVLLGFGAVVWTINAF